MVRPKILIVEDNDDLRQAVAAILISEDFEVLEARNGQEGLDSLRESRPDAILLDIEMPVMDGQEFIREMAKNPHFATIPVIFTTARGDATCRVRPQVFGGFFGKPFDIDRLLNVLHLWADRPA